MKHLWFGAGLLAALLTVSLWLGGVLEESHHPCAKDLEQAVQAAQEDNWSLASALYVRAEKHWDDNRNFSAVLTNHDLVGRIDAGFAMAEVYAACQDASSFCAACVRLAQDLRSLPQPHSFTWWNLL